MRVEHLSHPALQANCCLTRGQGDPALWEAYDSTFTESSFDIIMVPGLSGPLAFGSQGLPSSEGHSGTSSHQSQHMSEELQAFLGTQHGSMTLINGAWTWQDSTANDSKSYDVY